MASDAVEQVRQLCQHGFLVQEVFGARVSSVWYAILSRPSEAEVAEVSTAWIILSEDDILEVQDLMEQPDD